MPLPFRKVRRRPLQGGKLHRAGLDIQAFMHQIGQISCGTGQLNMPERVPGIGTGGHFTDIGSIGGTDAFRYGDDGVPVGLCRADRLYYVTTAGGILFPGGIQLRIYKSSGAEFLRDR